MTDANLGRLYPELAAGRRLATAIVEELRLLGSRVPVEDPLGSAYAVARVGRRHCQLHVELRKRAFGADLWDRGVRYGHVWSAEVGRVALVLHTFLEQGATISELEQLVPELEMSAEGRAHECGTLVDFQWKKILDERPEGWPDALLHEIFVVAAKGRFRTLTPFTSMNRACFSRRTGYPYTRDCPVIEALRDGRCRVFRSDESTDAEFAGDVYAAVARAEAVLPASVTSARDGTAEDDDAA